MEKRAIDRPRITLGFVFKSVFGDDPGRCRRLIEAALGTPIAEVAIVHGEHELDVGLDARAGRVDVFAVDADGNEYDVEVQARHKEDEWMRARHYQALMDATRLRRGDPVGSLRRCVVIFVCDFDPFAREGFAPGQRGWRVYDCATTCLQTGAVVPDGRRAVYLNARGTRGEVSDDLDAFLRFVAGERVDGNGLVGDIESRIDELMVDPAWLEDYMTFEEELEAERAWARREGRDEGYSQGRDDGYSQGRDEGRDAVMGENALLARALRDAGREGELALAMCDPAARDRLLAEFGIGAG